jgi:hypothetical protein
MRSNFGTRQKEKAESGEKKPKRSINNAGKEK